MIFMGDLIDKGGLEEQKQVMDFVMVELRLMMDVPPRDDERFWLSSSKIAHLMG